MDKIYTTKSGDLFDSIAFEQMGNEKYASALMKANPDYRDVIFFSAGINLFIPEIEQSDNAILPPWKK